MKMYKLAVLFAMVMFSALSFAEGSQGVEPRLINAIDNINNERIDGKGRVTQTTGAFAGNF